MEFHKTSQGKLGRACKTLDFPVRGRINRCELIRVGVSSLILFKMASNGEGVVKEVLEELEGVLAGKGLEVHPFKVVQTHRCKHDWLTELINLFLKSKSPDNTMSP